jgi:hypothetical protein
MRVPPFDSIYVCYLCCTMRVSTLDFPVYSMTVYTVKGRVYRAHDTYHKL